MDDPNPAERDTRYDSRITFTYVPPGRLNKQRYFGNNGTMWSRKTYTYEGNRRTQIDFGRDGQENSRTAYVVDSLGNDIEEYQGSGSDVDKYVMVNTYDPQGNWITQKTFEEKKRAGKPVRKLLWTSYRVIAYYP